MWQQNTQPPFVSSTYSPLPTPNQYLPHHQQQNNNFQQYQFEHQQQSSPFVATSTNTNNNNNVKPSTGFSKSLSTLVGRIATSSAGNSTMNSQAPQHHPFIDFNDKNNSINVPFYGSTNINNNNNFQNQPQQNNYNGSRSASSSATFTLSSTLARHHPPVVLNNIGSQNYSSPKDQNQNVANNATIINNSNNNFGFPPNINSDGAPQQVLIESLQNLVTFTCSQCGAKRQKGSHCSHCDHALPTVRRCLTCKAVARGKFCSQCGAPCGHENNNSNGENRNMMLQDSFEQAVIDDLQHMNSNNQSQSEQSNNTNNNNQALEGGYGAPQNQQWKAVDMAWKTRSGF